MDIFERLVAEGKAEGGHVFISHSRKDMDAVRALRNELERAGFDPLCFYLKCMELCDSDPALEEELRSLLRREIDAREWFVYVNSKNAEDSSWVAYERSCVARDPSKKVIRLDLQRETPEAAKKILRNMRVYISCHYGDRELAGRIARKLAQKDLQAAFDPDAAAPLTVGMTETESAVFQASQEGLVLAILSEKALQSAYVIRELEYARLNGGRIIPVLLGGVTVTGALSYMLAMYRQLRLPAAPTEEDLERLAEQIGAIAEKMGAQD